MIYCKDGSIKRRRHVLRFTEGIYYQIQHEWGGTQPAYEPEFSLATQDPNPEPIHIHTSNIPTGNQMEFQWTPQWHFENEDEQ